MFPLFRLRGDGLWTYPISVSSKIKTLALRPSCGKSFYSLNRSLLEVVGDWNGIGEDCGDSGIGIGDGGWADFGDHGGGLVEEEDSASGAVDEDFGSVGVDLWRCGIRHHYTLDLRYTIRRICKEFVLYLHLFHFCVPLRKQVHASQNSDWSITLQDK